MHTVIAVKGTIEDKNDWSASTSKYGEAAEMFKKDPTIWDKEIEQIAKEEGVE